MSGDFERAELGRLRSALDAAGGERPDPRRCPHPRLLWQAAHRQLEGSGLHWLVDHVAECPACARDWRAFESHPRPPVLREAEPAGRRWLAGLRPTVWVPASAMVLLLAATISLLVDFGPERPPVERGSELKIESLVPAGSAISRRDPLLRWSPVPGASSYDLVVATPDLTELVNQRGLTTPEMHLPPAPFSSLPPGSEITWQVTARLTDGGLLASETFSNRLE